MPLGKGKNGRRTSLAPSSPSRAPSPGTKSQKKLLAQRPATSSVSITAIPLDAVPVARRIPATANGAFIQPMVGAETHPISTRVRFRGSSKSVKGGGWIDTTLRRFDGSVTGQRLTKTSPSVPCPSRLTFVQRTCALPGHATTRPFTAPTLQPTSPIASFSRGDLSRTCDLSHAVKPGSVALHGHSIRVRDASRGGCMCDKRSIPFVDDETLSSLVSQVGRSHVCVCVLCVCVCVCVVCLYLCIYIVSCPPSAYTTRVPCMLGSSRRHVMLTPSSSIQTCSHPHRLCRCRTSGCWWLSCVTWSFS